MDDTASLGGAGGSFRIGTIWEDTWEKVPGTKRIYLLMTISVVVISAMVGVTIGTLLSLDGLVPGSDVAGSRLGERYGSAALALVQVLAAPLLAWYCMVGLQVADGEAPSPGSWWRYRGLWPKLMGLMAAIVIGEFLLIAALGSVGAFLSMLLYYALALGPFFIIDQDSSITEAMAGSLAIVRQNLGHFMLYVVVAWLLATLGAASLGIAFLWVIPFLSISSALIYRRTKGSGTRG